MIDHPTFMRLAHHVVSLLVALLFFILGGMKWLGLPIQGLEVWSYPTWFMLSIASLELCVGAFLILPKIRLLGVGLGLSLLIGAACTHASHGQWTEVVGTCVIATLLVGIAWLHTAQTH